MTHILDGDWSMFVGADPGGLNRDDQGSIHLEIDEGTGKLKSGSNQNGRPLRGKVEKHGQLHKIAFSNDESPRTYEGVFVAVVASGLERKAVMAGRIRLNFVLPNDALAAEADCGPERKDEREKDSDRFDQEQAIWVATKP